jgi:hypothetical protein
MREERCGGVAECFDERETYGKLPTQLSAIMLLRTHRDFYGPTLDVASVKLRTRVF